MGILVHIRNKPVFARLSYQQQIVEWKSKAYKSKKAKAYLNHKYLNALRLSFVVLICTFCQRHIFGEQFASSLCIKLRLSQLACWYEILLPGTTTLIVNRRFCSTRQQILRYFRCYRWKFCRQSENAVIYLKFSRRYSIVNTSKMHGKSRLMSNAKNL